ncbi:acyl-CoA dehydrogenase [Solihabitans fulvus]|uniref:Acyl-CoA dehydrogenase n=1 Tax=Solihabitans fulvus TaxID=1892852 RepID=A0A5B2WMF1_9PSEU|nr:acyl-CoA dehydrogenase [Solihabitans fulvus]
MSARELAFREEVRRWLAANVPREPLPSLETAPGFAAHRGWERILFDAGLSAVAWPSRYGGRDATLTEWLLFEEEYHAARAPARVGQNGLFLLAPTLFEHGTEAQRRRFLPGIASGEVVWAQAWSEPEAGSDLAAVRARADRTDGGWLLSGQKTWSSRAAFADRAFGLFRSDPGAERHRGLSYFLFPLTAEGVTVRPIARLDGKPAFAEIFLDSVFVPDEDVVGEVGQGWRVAMSTAGSERGLTLRSPGRFLASATRLVELWRTEGGGGALRDQVVDCWIAAQAYRLGTFETAARLTEGGSTGAEASLGKIFWSELDIAMHETALELLGENGELDSGAPDSWTAGYLFALAGPIYAGTNEIQRTVVAERLLGLPRADR